MWEEGKERSWKSTCRKSKFDDAVISSTANVSDSPAPGSECAASRVGPLPEDVRFEEVASFFEVCCSSTFQLELSSRPALHALSTCHETLLGYGELGYMLRLRPYQVEAITAVHRLASPSLHLADALRPQCLSALSNGFSRIGISAPTGQFSISSRTLPFTDVDSPKGSGKTVSHQSFDSLQRPLISPSFPTNHFHLRRILQAIFTALIDRLPALIHRRSNPSSSFRPLLATKCLIIVPSLEIAFQTRTTISKLLPLRTVHLEQGPRRTDGTADVVVATYQVHHFYQNPLLRLLTTSQTLARNDCERLYAQFDPLDYKAVIVSPQLSPLVRFLQKLTTFLGRRGSSFCRAIVS